MSKFETNVVGRLAVFTFKPMWCEGFPLSGTIVAAMPYEDNTGVEVYVEVSLPSLHMCERRMREVRETTPNLLPEHFKLPKGIECTSLRDVTLLPESAEALSVPADWRCPVCAERDCTVDDTGVTCRNGHTSL